jgi:hypothetical protein
MAKMKRTDCEMHEEKLRQMYIATLPAKRWGTIKQRLASPESGPNLLIIYVSAVEALARSIAVHSSTAPEIAYKKLKFQRAKDLLEIVAEKRLQKTASDVFGAQDFESFECAEKYRDLLVHECTSLRQGFTGEMIQVCDRILTRLRKI